MDGEATKPLGRWEKLGIGLFFLLLVAFGCLVEQKSAFLTRRMGDLDVFLRAAWAVRNDADLYSITSDNDWHYLYPPLYAILLTPLADPPRGADGSGYLPYAVSVAIMYLVSVCCLFLSAHVLASALEVNAGWQTQPRYGRRWWLLRLWPVIVCLLPVGHTLMRGQANVIVLALLCAAMAGWLRKQNFRAGWWLALAICIKVIPAYLLVYPLWQRDGRALLGCSVGCFVGLILIPLLTFGPTRTLDHYENYARAFLGPYFNVHNDDRTREEVATTDSIGVKNALHNWMYGPEKHNHEMHPGAKAAYLLLGFAMTFLTLWPGARSKGEWSGHAAHQFAGLILLMVFFSPVTHMHYLLFCLPIVMSLLAHVWQNDPNVRVPWQLASCFVVFNVAMAIAYLPGLEILKDLCLPLFTTLPLWIIPTVQTWRGMSPAKSAAPAMESRKAA